MKKKLWALNLLLLAAIGLLGRELRNNWRASREREHRVLNKPVKPVAAPAVAPQPPPPALQAAGYFEIAQKMLFSRDRNPDIVVEPVAAKPVPAFPRFFGVMNLGDGNTVFLSDGPGRQRPFQAGEKVGEFKVAEIGAETITFEWEQKKFLKKFSELQDRTDANQQQPETRQPGGPIVVTPAAPRPVEPVKSSPGVDIGGGLSACNSNDPSPAGTVVDGKRKVITESPFGKVCRWEPVGK